MVSIGKLKRTCRAPILVPALLLLLLAAQSGLSAGQSEASDTGSPNPDQDQAATSTPSSAPPPSSTAKPNSSVDYALVDRLFLSASPDEADVVAKWRSMDKQLQEGVRALLKTLVPQLVALSSEARVSGSCSGAILKLVLNLRNMRSWAVKMIDAIGKPSAGLLEGSLTLFGNYRECLSVRAPDEDEIEISTDNEFKEYFRGKYCVLQLKPLLPPKPRFYTLNTTIQALQRKSYKYYEKNAYDELAELALVFNFLSIRADLCVPSLCSRDDIQKVATYLGSKMNMRARVQRCDVEPLKPVAVPTDDWPLIASVTFISLLLLAVCLSTVLASQRLASAKSHRAHSILSAMSVTRSWAHVGDVRLERIGQAKPLLLYSIRLLILGWIFVAGLVSQLDFQFMRDLLTLRSMLFEWPMQLLVNSSLAYSTLILLTAFTYSYQNINSNLSDLVKYLLSKYTRLMPSIMLFVALTILTPFLYQYKSPIWVDFVGQPAQVCRETGLVNLLFIQNFLPADQICLPQTWIFCVELQLCILFVPIVYSLNRTFDTHHGRFKLASKPVLALIGLCLAGCLLNFWNTYANSLPASWFLTYGDKDDRVAYMTQHLHRTSTHLSTFALGLLAGHLCRCKQISTFSGRPYGRSACNNLTWLASLALMAALIFGTHQWSLAAQHHLDYPLASALYASLAPLLWSACWSLSLFHLLIPNEKDQTASLASLLAEQVTLVRLGRLAFLAYLINPYVNQLFLAIQEQPVFSSVLMVGHTLIGNIVITFLLALTVSVLVEIPARRLFKKILIGPARKGTNLGVLTRQLDIRQANHGPSHDSFTTTTTTAPPHHHQHQPRRTPSNMSARKEATIPLNSVHLDTDGRHFAANNHQVGTH